MTGSTFAGMSTASFLMILGVASVFFAPFLLFTGSRTLGPRRMLMVFASLFGVIILVNIVMAVTAVRSFPGLETGNSYVASQNFDRERAAQQALGWTASPSYDGRTLSLTITDSAGLPARISGLRVVVGRPTQKRDDVTPEMRYQGGLWLSDLTLAPGAWVVHLEADAPDGTVFRQRLANFPGAMVRG